MQQLRIAHHLVERLENRLILGDGSRHTGAVQSIELALVIALEFIRVRLGVIKIVAK